MSAYEFNVEQRPIPGTHKHHWVATDAGAAVIDLPEGGTSDHLGRYPEIVAYLAGQGVIVALDFSRDGTIRSMPTMIRTSTPGSSTPAAGSS